MSFEWESEASETVGHVRDDLGSRELDQLFLLHAAALETGEALWQWWFRWRAQVQDATTQDALESVLRDSLETIARAIGADGLAVLLADESGELVVRTAIGMQPTLWQSVHIASGAGMAGRVLAERRPWVVPDLSKIEVVSRTLRESGVQSLVAVPVLGHHRALGVLHADSFELDHFSESDVPLLALVADRIGAAIEQVALFEAERDARGAAEAAAFRLARLQRVTAALSRDLTAEQVAEVVLEELGDDIDGEAVAYLIWMVVGDRLHLLRSSEASPASDAYRDVSLEEDLPGPTVVRTGQPLWFSSQEELRAFPGMEEAWLLSQSLALLPLAVEDQVLGLLAVVYPRPRQFSDDERRFLSVVARQAAESLHRASARRARIRAARDNALLADVSAALGSSLDSSTSLRRALVELVPAMAEFATIHLFDKLGTPRRAALLHGDPEVDAMLAKAAVDPAHEAQGVLRVLAAAGRRPRLVPVQSDPPDDWALDHDHAEQVRSLGVTSAIAVPLVSRGEVLGLLGLMRLSGSDPYGEADLALADEIGSRVSVAVDNAMQSEQRVAVARALQASLLPPELVEIPGTEVAAVFHPAGTGAEVGGDFYDLFPVDAGRWVLMIGDVSGSGPAAAALTAQVRHGARVAARAGLAPAAVVTAVNATLDETTGSEWFCTMVYAELVPHDQGVDMEVICAGHVPPLLVSASGVDEVECQAPLLGVLPSANFTARRLQLAPGDALVLVTDGATEARPAGGRRSDAMFGEARLRQVVGRAAGCDAQGLVEAVAESVLEFAGGRLDDDLALMVLRAAPRRGPQETGSRSAQNLGQ